MATHPALPPSLSTSLHALLGRLSQRIRRRIADKLDVLDVDERAVNVLAAIEHESARSQRALGDALAIDRTTMVGVIDRLEERGWVARERNPDDRRVWSVVLTEKGASTVEWLLTMRAEAEAEALAALTDHQASELVRLLRKATDADDV